MPEIDPSWGLDQEVESKTQPIPVVKSQIPSRQQSQPIQPLPTSTPSLSKVNQAPKSTFGKSSPQPNPAPQIPQPATSPDLPGPKTGWPNWIKGLIATVVVLVVGLLFFFLSEAGFISTGLEGLWGLPNNATKAFSEASQSLLNIGTYQLTGSADLDLTSSTGQSTLSGTFTQDVTPKGSRIQAELTLVGNSQEAAQIFGPVLAAGNKVQLELVNIGQDLYLRIPDQEGEEIWTKVPLSDVALIDLRPFGWSEVLTAVAENSTDSKRQGGKTYDGVKAKGYQAQIPLKTLTSLMIPNLNLSDSLTLESFLNAKNGQPYSLEFSSPVSSTNLTGNLSGKVEFTSLGESGEVTPPSVAQVDSQTLEVWLTENGFTPSETNTGRDAKRKSDLRQISIALANVAAASQPFSYPVTDGPVRLDQAPEITRQLAAFIDQVPTDPLSPDRYYGYESDGSSFKLTAALEDEGDQQGLKVGNFFLFIIESRGIVQ